MNVWLSSGESHLWHPQQTQPATPWEAEIDKLMQQQLVTLDYTKRKGLYDRFRKSLPKSCLSFASRAPIFWSPPKTASRISVPRSWIPTLYGTWNNSISSERALTLSPGRRP